MTSPKILHIKHMFLGLFYVPKTKRKKHKNNSCQLPKNIFLLSRILFLRLSLNLVSKNVNHSVLIVASIKSLINVFENVKNISLVGEKKKRSSEVKMWHVRNE